MDEYTDPNGIVWRLLLAPANGNAQGSVSAYTQDDAPKIYSKAQDLGPVFAAKGDAVGAREVAAIKKLIDAWAGQHRGEVELRVTAKKGDGMGWLLVALLVLVALDDG